MSLGRERLAWVAVIALAQLLSWPAQYYAMSIGAGCMFHSSHSPKSHGSAQHDPAHIAGHKSGNHGHSSDDHPCCCDRICSCAFICGKQRSVGAMRTAERAWLPDIAETAWHAAEEVISHPLQSPRDAVHARAPPRLS